MHPYHENTRRRDAADAAVVLIELRRRNRESAFWASVWLMIMGVL